MKKYALYDEDGNVVRGEMIKTTDTKVYIIKEDGEPLTFGTKGAAKAAAKRAFGVKRVRLLHKNAVRKIV